MIELYKDGNVMAIQTDAKDEREFIDGFSNLLSDMIYEGKFMNVADMEYIGPEEKESEARKELSKSFGNDWAFQFNEWLPQMVDICCKYRGYKNTVHEKKLLIAGNPNVNGLNLEGTSEHRNIKEEANGNRQKIQNTGS